MRPDRKTKGTDSNLETYFEVYGKSGRFGYQSLRGRFLGLALGPQVQSLQKHRLVRCATRRGFSSGKLISPGCKTAYAENSPCTSFQALSKGKSFGLCVPRLPRLDFFQTNQERNLRRIELLPGFAKVKKRWPINLRNRYSPGRSGRPFDFHQIAPGV